MRFACVFCAYSTRKQFNLLIFGVYDVPAISHSFCSLVEIVLAMRWKAHMLTATELFVKCTNMWSKKYMWLFGVTARRKRDRHGFRLFSHKLSGFYYCTWCGTRDIWKLFTFATAHTLLAHVTTRLLAHKHFDFMMSFRVCVHVE